MIRNLKILLIVVGALSLQQAYAAGEAEGDQHENEEAEHAGEENQSRQIHLTPEQTELLSIQTVAATRRSSDLPRGALAQLLRHLPRFSMCRTAWPRLVRCWREN